MMKLLYKGITKDGKVLKVKIVGIIDVEGEIYHLFKDSNLHQLIITDITNYQGKREK